ncbi:MAG: hypothetical protein IJR17_04960 [Clostridia bacterium]|nr:hypothetical protein [Clostridia bacterium]
MKCPNCGSSNVRSEQKQAPVIVNNKLKSHGFLWWLLLGWIYLAYILVKAVFKAIFFVLIGWWTNKIKKDKQERERKAIVHICQDCGHRWETP